MPDARPNALHRLLHLPSRAGAPLVIALAATLAGCQTAPPAAPAPPTVFPDDYAVVDLTRPLDADTPFLPHRDGFLFERVALQADDDGRHVGAWSVLETMGTHVEMPSVFGGDGEGVARLPVTHLVAPLRVLDAPPALRARDEQGTPLPAAVGIPRILGHEALHGRIPRGAAVVLRTGMGAVPSGQLDRAGRIPDDAAPHAGWSAEAIRFLAVERGVRVVGTDALVVDAALADTGAPAARAAAESGLATLSGLVALESLPGSGAVIVIGALPVEGARAAPVRALAFVPPSRPARSAAGRPDTP